LLLLVVVGLALVVVVVVVCELPGGPLGCRIRQVLLTRPRRRREGAEAPPQARRAHQRRTPGASASRPIALLAWTTTHQLAMRPLRATLDLRSWLLLPHRAAQALLLRRMALLSQRPQSPRRPLKTLPRGQQGGGLAIRAQQTSKLTSGHGGAA
jgi:hypothetical protein